MNFSPADNVQGPIQSIDFNATAATGASQDWTGYAFVRAVFTPGTIPTGQTGSAGLEFSSDGGATWFTAEALLGEAAGNRSVTWTDAESNIPKVIEVETAHPVIGGSPTYNLVRATFDNAAAINLRASFYLIDPINTSNHPVSPVDVSIYSTVTNPWVASFVAPSQSNTGGAGPTVIDSPPNYQPVLYSGHEVRLISQTGHGFPVAADTLIPVRLDGSGNWVGAQADAEANIAGMFITGVPDANSLRIQARGGITNTTGHGFTRGDVLYLDPASAGGVTNVRPSGAGQWIQRLAYILDANDMEILAGVAFPVSTASAANDRAHARNADVLPAAAGAPTNAEMEAWATAQSVTDTVVRYTGTDTATDPATYVFHIDNSGSATLVQAPASVANDAAHVRESDVTLATAGAPTVAEIEAWATAQSVTDSLAFYTGTDTDTDPITYVFGIDGSGEATLLERPPYAPSNRVHADSSTVAASDITSPTDAEIQAFVTAQGITDGTVYYTGNDNPASTPSFTYLVDAAGVIDRVRRRLANITEARTGTNVVLAMTPRTAAETADALWDTKQPIINNAADGSALTVHRRNEWASGTDVDITTLSSTPNADEWFILHLNPGETVTITDSGSSTAYTAPATAGRQIFFLFLDSVTVQVVEMAQPDTIYNADGALPEDRKMEMVGNDLTFEGSASRITQNVSITSTGRMIAGHVERIQAASANNSATLTPDMDIATWWQWAMSSTLIPAVTIANPVGVVLNDDTLEIELRNTSSVPKTITWGTEYVDSLNSQLAPFILSAGESRRWEFRRTNASLWLNYSESPRSASDLLAELSQWTAGGVGAEPVALKASDGQLAVRLEGTDATTGSAIYFVNGAVPTATDTYVRVRLARNAAATSSFVFSYDDNAGNGAGIAINPATGATAPASAGAPPVTPSVVRSNVTDSAIELVIFFPAYAAAVNWSMTPNWGLLADIGTFDASAVGFVDLLDLDLSADFEPAAAGTAVLIDSSGGASVETLDAATGAGSIVFYANEDVASNSATLAVQAGESLNGVTDGTFLFSNYPNGTQFRADDVGAGEWVVSVVGAPSNQSINVVAATSADIIGISGSTFTTGTTNPTGGQCSINEVSYYDDGPFRYISVTLYWDDDDQIDLQVGPAIMPAGGKILDAQMSADEGVPAGTTAMAGVRNVSFDDRFFVNRADGISVDISGTVRLKVYNPQGQGAQVLAGMVTPTTLGVHEVVQDLEAASFDGFEFRLSDADRQAEMRYVGTGSGVITNATALYFKGDGGSGSSASRNITLDSNWVPVWTDLSLTQNVIGDHEELHWTHEGVDYWMQAIVGNSYTNNRIIIERKGQQTVVMPDALTPVDVRVLLGSGTGLASNSSVTISDTWGNLAATYDQVDFEFTTDSGTLNIRQSMSVNTANWTDGERVVLNADATTIVVRNMDIAGSTANLFLSGDVTTGTLRIYGVRAHQTVVLPDTVEVDDQPASGYQIIGDTLYQWGRGTTAGTGIVAVNYPTAFSSTSSYGLTLTAANSSHVEMTYDSDTTTGFQAIARDTAGGAVATSFSWMAIGQKP